VSACAADAAEKQNIPLPTIAQVLEFTEEQAQRILGNIKQKRRATEYLRQTLSLL